MTTGPQVEQSGKRDTSAQPEAKALRRIFVLAVLGWTCLLLASAWLNFNTAQRTMMNMARHTAQNAIAKDIDYRAWNAGFGGVYAPITEANQPNPYLSPDKRDLTAPWGTKLTKINPAYMTRQVHEMTLKTRGAIAHLTSLKPLRPANKPDDWERAALLRFDAGDASEVSQRQVIDGKEYMRVIRPLQVKKTCLACHGQQGYQVGQVRGGLSVAIPLEPYHAAFMHKVKILIITHLVIWALGLLGLWFMGRRITSQMDAQLIAQAKLRKATRVAEEASQAKTRFLANMSHELRTPLNSIIGFSDVLADKSAGEINEQQSQYLGHINQSGKSLLELIEGILEISKIEDGQLSLQKTRFPLMTLLENSLLAIKDQAGKNSITLNLASSNQMTDYRLEADEKLLSRAIHSLLENALKFSPPGSDVTLEAGLQEDALEIRVIDHGEGVEPADQERIFEPFVQADSSLTRKHAGAGMGLAIARAYVQKHNGEIFVRSHGRDQGAAFIIRLPIPTDS